MMQRLEIEYTSDCATCTARHESDWDLLASVKCDLLTGVICPECGREFNLLIVDESAQ